MQDYGLSTQQLQVIDALSSGVNLTTAAKMAGVHRNTINNWRRNRPIFQIALSEAQYDRAMLFREKTEDLADLAYQAVHDLLADPKTPAGVRLKAALAIINSAITPPAPKKQVELDIEKLVLVEKPQPPVHNSAQPASPADRPASAPASAPTREIAHKPAQSTRVPHPKIGRNEPCPCGSGQKYKRCCLEKHNRPVSAAA